MDFINLLSRIPNLHLAEVHILALAKELNGIAIVDENIAREVARIYNIQTPRNSLPHTKTTLQTKTFKKQAKEAIDRMVSAGWRLTAEEYAKLIKELE